MKITSVEADSIKAGDIVTNGYSLFKIRKIISPKINSEFEIEVEALSLRNGNSVGEVKTFLCLVTNEVMLVDIND